MEITNTSWQVPGINNLYTGTDNRSVLKLSCKPYDHKLINEVSPADVSLDPAVPYESLDVYFNELINQSAAQDTAAEVTPSVPSVQKTGGVDTTTDKPIVDRSENDVWNGF